MLLKGGSETMLGGYIKEARKKYGITQGELADMLHVTTQAVSAWECDINHPDHSLWPALKKTLNIDVASVYDTMENGKGLRKLSELTEDDEILSEVRKLIGLMDLDREYQVTVKKLVEDTICIATGYQMYSLAPGYRRTSEKTEDYFRWPYVADVLSELLSQETGGLDFGRLTESDGDSCDEDPIRARIAMIETYIESKFGEDDSEYTDPYQRISFSMAAHALNCCHHFLTLYPKRENVISTLYRVALDEAYVIMCRYDNDEE